MACLETPYISVNSSGVGDLWRGLLLRGPRVSCFNILGVHGGGKFLKVSLGLAWLSVIIII